MQYFMLKCASVPLISLCYIKIIIKVAAIINRKYYVGVFRYQVYQARLNECLLTSRGLPINSTSVLRAKPGKLDIKRREHGILFISLPISSLLKSATSSGPDKATCREIDNVDRATCNNAVNIIGN